MLVHHRAYCIRETALRADFRNNGPHYVRTARFATREVVNLKLREETLRENLLQLWSYLSSKARRNDRKKY